MCEDLLELNRADIKEQVLQEYWDTQYPYNQSRPLFRDKMMEDLKCSDLKLSQIRKKYCSLYDLKEYIWKKRIVIKKLMGRGRK